MSMTIYDLIVENVIEETKDTYSFQLQVPGDKTDAFAYKAGQYITVVVDVNGREERRAYSLSSSPTDDNIQFTVKRVKGGKVSNYLIDQVSPGGLLSIIPPDGKFVVLPEADKTKDHYFIAAGSGITPIMSMVKTILEEEARSSVYLLYGSRAEQDIIFKQELDHLVSHYSGQLTVHHTLSQSEGKKGLFGFLKKKAAPWDGLKGRIDGNKIDFLLREHSPKHSETHFYICGPGNMIQLADKHLQGKGYDDSQIHKEYFSDPDSKVTNAVHGEGLVTVTLDGETFAINVPKSKTILEALLDQDKSAPYSCTSGACASCMAKKLSGEVEMETSYSLDDDEIANGIILACQAHPVGDGVEITFDNI